MAYTSSCVRAMAVAIENKADKAQKHRFQWQTRFSPGWNNIRFLPGTATYASHLVYSNHTALTVTYTYSSTDSRHCLYTLIGQYGCQREEYMDRYYKWAPRVKRERHTF